MKKRILSLALALAMCLGMLPVTVLAAKETLPDWHFLFAIFKNMDTDCVDKNGKKQHIKYTMPQEEIDFAREIAANFEAYMNEVGVMRAHVDIIEIDTTIKDLKDSQYGSWLSPTEAEPLLTGKVDLDQYDHVFGVIYLNDVSVGYAGLTGGALQNGTGYSCIDHKYRDLTPVGMSFPSSVYVHEFLHFMCALCEKWGITYDLHKAGDTYNAEKIDKWKGYYTDIILNRATGGYGTGVTPIVWQYPPHVLRTIGELNVPSGVTSIGDWAFLKNNSLKKVTIPSSVVSIGYDAFGDCGSLAEVTIQPGPESIGEWAFGKCLELTKVTIPASVVSIGECAFYKTGLTDVYYSGTQAQWNAIQIGEYNQPLTNAAIHYNSAPPAGNAAAAPTNDKLTVDGVSANPTVYKIGDSNYFKIRDVAALLNGTGKQFAVGYDGEKNSVTAVTGQGYTKLSGDLAGPPAGGSKTAEPSNDTIYVDGQKIVAEVYKIDGGNYFKLRDLGKALDFYVGWSAEQGMYIQTDRPYSE